jgi:ABC-2 type transport system permease protein
MIRQIFSTTYKDLKILFTDVGGIAMLFLMPLMFIIVMSIALQGLFETGTDTQPRQLPVVNLDHGQYAAEIIQALDDIDGIELETTWDGANLTTEKAEELISNGDRSVSILFPADFSAQIESRFEDDDATATVILITNPTVSTQFIAPIQGMVFGATERIAETAVAQARIEKSLADAFAQLPAKVRPELDQTNITTGKTNIVTLNQVAPAEMNIEVFPDTYQQNVPGYTVFGVFTIVGAMASSILQEKQAGTFRRLLVAPIARPVLLIGKILPYYLVNLIQIGIMFGTAHLLFGMVLGDLKALILISMALAAAATGLGTLVAALGKTGTQVGGLTTLLTLTTSAIGGCMMPATIMPSFLQTLSRLTPQAWAMQGFQDVLIRGCGVSQVLTESAILMGFAAVFFSIGVWRFRFE